MKFRRGAVLVACILMIAGIVAAALWYEPDPKQDSTAAVASPAFTDDQSLPATTGIPRPGVATPEGSALQGNDEPSLAAPVMSPPYLAPGYQGVDESDRLSHPYYRALRLAELRSTIGQGYPGLVEELGLTATEQDQFFGLLAEGRVALEAEAAVFEREPVDLVAAAGASRARQIRQRQHADVMRNLLGDERLARWQAYQQHQTEWLQAGVYSAALAQSGAPLDGGQTRAIALALIAENQRRKQDTDTVMLARTVDPQSSQIRAESRMALSQGQEQSNQRILNAAAPYLGAYQLDLLRDQISLQQTIDTVAGQ